MASQVDTTGGEFKDSVKERYGQIAQGIAASSGSEVGCCGPSAQPFSAVMAVEDIIPLSAPLASCCEPGSELTNARLFYAQAELAGLPSAATAASLGCGNPTAIAALQPGQVVLDLGSGGGIDCFLAARQVGPAGRVIGLDMTPAMIELAERNKATLGAAASNVTFQLGEMEAMPLPDGSVDVIISNCVINLSPDKDAVLHEAYRVLRPGGTLAISDTVTLRPMPPALAESMAAWSACVAGALDVEAYATKLQAAGFVDTQIFGLTPTDFGISAGLKDGAADVAADLARDDLKQWIASAVITAQKR